MLGVRCGLMRSDQTVQEKEFGGEMWLGRDCRVLDFGHLRHPHNLHLMAGAGLCSIAW